MKSQTSSPKNIVRLLGLVLLLSTLLGCNNKTSSPNTLQVFAASSLQEAFAHLKKGFEAAHPKTKVMLTFAGSQILRLQIAQGARADIFASANLSHMKSLKRSGLVRDSRTFAVNKLVLIVPPTNPANLKSFRELTRAKRIVVGTSNVPIGSYTRNVLKKASKQWGDTFQKQVTKNIVSNESNVRLVRAKIELGEADAAIVYQTDAVSSKRLRWFPIPRRFNEVAHYTTGIVTSTPRMKMAKLWVKFLLSQQGQTILQHHGFQAP